MSPDCGCAVGAAAETPLGGGVATCSTGGANLAPVSPSSVIRVVARLTSSRKYQASQAMSAGQTTIFRNSRKTLILSSTDISPAPQSARRPASVIGRVAIFDCLLARSLLEGAAAARRSLVRAFFSGHRYLGSPSAHNAHSGLLGCLQGAYKRNIAAACDR